MALYTKCIYKERLPSDGVRISIMSRHTLDDGVTPDENITPESFDEHKRELAPKSRLVGGYYKGRLSWSEFEMEFVKQIREDGSTQAIDELAQRALTEDVTILCKEDDPANCHRRIVAEECKLRKPNLEVFVF